MSRLAARALIFVIRLYQRTISRVLPPTCRFHPACSAYMAEAVEVHGVGRGLLLGLWRIVRCNPFSRGGDDPVPPVADARRRPQGAKAATPSPDELRNG